MEKNLYIVIIDVYYEVYEVQCNLQRHTLSRQCQYVTEGVQYLTCKWCRT